MVTLHRFGAITLVMVYLAMLVGLATMSSGDTGSVRQRVEPALATMRPAYLRCEYRVNPLGIDVLHPRLSWVLESIRLDERNQRQTAYQILVASNEENLQANKGNLWDSGKVESDQTVHIVYGGKELESGMECWWRVRVWDREGGVSAWSEPARWTMGLLEPDLWQGKWIEEPVPLTFERCMWVWFPEGNPRQSAPAGRRYFRRRFTIPKGKIIRRARFLIAADDQFTLSVNGKNVGEGNGEKEARPQTLDITERLTEGINSLAIAVRNTSASPAGLTGKLVIELSSHKQLVVVIDKSWKVSSQEQAGWEQLDFDDSAWPAAKEIAYVGELGTPWGVPGRSDDLILYSPPYLRKAFSVSKPIKRAVVYASALGLYELHINGRRVAEDYFTPGWSDYRKRVYYNTYEVADFLQQGQNAIGAILADGWYAGYLAWGHIRNRYDDDPKLRLQLRIEYTDGTTRTVGTDELWKFSHGPILEADFLMGETYDARKEITGWDTPEFNDSAWQPVVVTDRVDLKIQAYPGVTVQKTEEIPAKTVNEPSPGVYVFDLGQNMVGWVRLKIRGETGRKIVLRFAEVLNPDGTIYVTNLRGARTIDTYYLKGGGEEIWEPKFTFHGFRYVELTGYPGHPSPDAVTGIVAHTALTRAGHFECSNSMINQLVDNIIWCQRGNYLEVPTDCPQRDERLGWTGDAQAFMRTGSYNMDVASFFAKWLIDVKDSQNEAGAYAHVAPDVEGVGAGSPVWSDAGIICPYTMYLVYGDTRIIERRYDSMAKYIEYLKKDSENLVRPAFGYGDWLSLNADTPKEVIATAYFAHVSKLMAEMAKAIGRRDDVKKYEELSENVTAAFNKAFVSRNGQIKNNTQTGYALSLHMDLLPERLRPSAVRHLIRDLMVRNWHVSTGFPGLRHLFPVLTRFGRNDVAYRLLLNDTFPSWGYQIKHGATTIWERWDGWTEEFGFQDPGMNSFNHYAFGSVGEWLFTAVAGIDTDGPGFKRIIIRPQPGGGLNYVKAHYNSIHGWIDSEWRLEGNSLHLNVRIPVNTTATVFVPARDAGTVTESGKSAGEAEGVEFVRVEDGEAVYHITSGHYTFVSKEVDFSQ